MWTGHFGAAYIGKLFAPGVSLGALMFATCLSDFTFLWLNMLGVRETMKLGTELPGVFQYYNDYPISHSLLGTAILGAIFAVGYSMKNKKNIREVAVIFGVAVSHWFLELPGHRKDVSLLPATPPFFGAGLFNSVTITFILEALVAFPAYYIYLKNTRPKPAFSRAESEKWVWVNGLNMVGQHLFFCFGHIPSSDTRFVHPIGYIAFILAAVWTAHKVDETRFVDTAGIAKKIDSTSMIHRDADTKVRPVD